MRVVSGRLHGYSHPLDAPVVTARTVLAERRGILLELIDDGGNVGLGEAAPWPGWGAPLDMVRADLERVLQSSSRLWSACTTISRLGTPNSAARGIPRPCAMRSSSATSSA